MSAKVRLIDIAKAAGVSVSSVSKALKDSPEISQDTKDHILAFADQLGYRPNFMARSLRLGRSNLLGVLIPDITNPYYASILKGVEAKARSYGLTTIITITNEDPAIEQEALNAFLSVPVDGILSVPINLSNYTSIKSPLVFLSRFPFRTDLSYAPRSVPRTDFHYVLSDDFQGQYLATKHLLDCGMEDVYLLLSKSTPKFVSSMKNSIRLSGYQKALEEYHIPYNPDKVFYYHKTDAPIPEFIHHLCQNTSSPFGLCLLNDSVASEVIGTLYEHGRRIPEDVQLVGYDDVEVSKHQLPPLTTIHSAKQSIGEYGVSLINDIINRPSPTKAKIHTIFDPYLVVRKSTKQKT